MDLALFFQILRRRKKLVIGGTVLAVVLAVFAYGQPGLVNGKPTIIPRGMETWQAQSELLITQSGDPYGSAIPEYTPGSAKSDNPPALVGDPTRMSVLAPIYASLANGTAVQDMIQNQVRIDGKVSASASSDPYTGAGLPFLVLTARAGNGPGAVQLAMASSSILEHYVNQQQAAANIAPSQRVLLQVVQTGNKASLIQGHKKTTPILVFVAIFCAVVAMAFILENGKRKAALASGTVPFDAGMLPANGLDLRMAPANGNGYALAYGYGSPNPAAYAHAAHAVGNDAVRPAPPVYPAAVTESDSPIGTDAAPPQADQATDADATHDRGGTRRFVGARRLTK